MTSLLKPLALAASLFATSALADPGAYLEITLQIAPENRATAAIYAECKEPFLTTVPGAESKTLLIRDEDVQVHHGFTDAAAAYLASDLFKQDVFVALAPLVMADPEVRIYLTN